METSAKYEERAARINQDIFGVINAKAIYSNSLAEINKKNVTRKLMWKQLINLISHSNVIKF